MWGSMAMIRPTKTKLGPDFWSPAMKLGARTQSHDSHEGRQANGIEDPHGRFGDTSEGRTDGPKIAEHETHD